MFQTKFVEKVKTHISCSIIFSPLKLRHDLEKHGRAMQTTDESTMRDKGIACWVNEATNALSEYVIIIAFPLQQWLHESTSMPLV
jgi:hypothetical protein